MHTGRLLHKGILPANFPYQEYSVNSSITHGLLWVLPKGAYTAWRLHSGAGLSLRLGSRKRSHSPQPLSSVTIKGTPLHQRFCGWKDYPTFLHSWLFPERFHPPLSWRIKGSKGGGRRTQKMLAMGQLLYGSPATCQPLSMVLPTHWS